MKYIATTKSIKGLILTVLILFNISLAEAQKPSSGYMGKKIAITAGVGGYLTYYFDDISNPDKVMDFFQTYANYQFSADYSINNQGSFGIDFGFGKFERKVDKIIGFNNNVQIDFNSYNVSQKKIGIHYTMYPIGYIAPIGTYFRYGLTYHSIKSDDFMQDMEKSLDTYYGVSNVLAGTNKSLTMYKLNLTVGQKIILVKNLTLDVGAEINVNLRNPLDNVWLNDFIYYNVPTFQQSFFKDYTAPIYRRAYFGFITSVGYLF